MKHFELKGQIRETGNQAVIKALRRQGFVPCNLYGQGIKNVLFTVSEKDLKGLTHNPSSYIVDLVLSDGNKYQAILHELQFHPVKDNCLHVDFLSVSDDKPIAIEVPIAITGHAAGVQAGGKFFQLKRKLRVSALMKDLPDEIKIDISKLKIGERIVAGDIHLDNVAILTFKGTILCTVKSTRQAAPGAVDEGETSAESEAEESAE